MKNLRIGRGSSCIDSCDSIRVEENPSKEPLRDQLDGLIDVYQLEMAPPLQTGLYRLTFVLADPPTSAGVDVLLPLNQIVQPFLSILLLFFLVHFMSKKFWRRHAYQRTHADVLPSSGSWTCTAGHLGGLPENRRSVERGRHLLPRWSGLSVTHSTAHPSTGGPHLNAALLCRSSPGIEYLQAQECFNVKNMVKGLEIGFRWRSACSLPFTSPLMVYNANVWDIVWQEYAMSYFWHF